MSVQEYTIIARDDSGSYPTHRAFAAASYRDDIAPSGVYLSHRSNSGWLSEADARALAEWLANRYGLLPYATAEVGETVQLVPAFTYHGATRAEILTTQDDEGDYLVKILDGDRPNHNVYRRAEAIRHADAIMPKPEAETAQPVALVKGAKARVTGDSAGWRHWFANDTVVTLIDGSDNHGSRGDGLPGWYCKADSGRYRNVHANDLEAIEPEPTPEPFRPEAGDIVRVLPGARWADGSNSADALSSATRAAVLDGEDDQGDIHALALDGSRKGEQAHAAARFFAPLDDESAPDRPWAVGDEAIITEDDPWDAPLFKGDRVTVVSNANYPEETHVQFVSGKGQACTWRSYWIVQPHHIRRP